MENKLKTVLNQIPELLSSDDDLNKTFEKSVNQLKTIVDFENAYVCYLNAGCANIQYKDLNSDVNPVAKE